MHRFWRKGYLCACRLGPLWLSQWPSVGWDSGYGGRKWMLSPQWGQLDFQSTRGLMPTLPKHLLSSCLLSTSAHQCGGGLPGSSAAPIGCVVSAHRVGVEGVLSSRPVPALSPEAWGWSRVGNLVAGRGRFHSSGFGLLLSLDQGVTQMRTKGPCSWKPCHVRGLLFLRCVAGDSPGPLVTPQGKVVLSRGVSAMCGD